MLHKRGCFRYFDSSAIAVTMDVKRNSMLNLYYCGLEPTFNTLWVARNTSSMKQECVEGNLPMERTIPFVLSLRSSLHALVGILIGFSGHKISHPSKISYCLEYCKTLLTLRCCQGSQAVIASANYGLGCPACIAAPQSFASPPLIFGYAISLTTIHPVVLHLVD